MCGLCCPAGPVDDVRRDMDSRDVQPANAEYVNNLGIHRWGNFSMMRLPTRLTLCPILGIAVWVFFILANANQYGPTITTNTNCNFTLDGSHAGTFVHNPDMSTLDLVYNASVFSASGLSNSQHQLVIWTNDVPFNVFVNFDYAIYTYVPSLTRLSLFLGG